MSWWGKLVGGAVGYALGGPLGALLGAALGHQLDQRGRGRATAPPDHERTQAAFFTAAFSVMGHMAKADGRVTADEIELANRVMGRMALNAEQRELARRLFRQGKRPEFSLEQVLEQLRHETRSRDLLRMLLEIQVFAAYADGRVHPAERTILARVCAQLGFDPDTLAQVEMLVQAELRHEFTGAAPEDPAVLDDAYAVLGVSRDSTDAEVKRAYRRLMSQHHPDKLVAKGLPEEMMRLATAETQEIKAAYERIRDARKRAATA